MKSLILGVSGGIYLSFSINVGASEKINCIQQTTPEGCPNVEFIDRSKEYRSNASYGLFHTHCMV
jgi:hypothetical protein